MFLTKPKEWESYQRIYPPGFVPIETKDAVSHPNVLKAAKTFIDRNVRANKPIGWREMVQVDGRDICLTIEPHFHEPNGPIKPWGWHKGCSVAVEPPHYNYGPQVAGESDMGMDTTKVKHVAVVAVPAIGGLVFLGPLGAVLGLVGGLAWNHFKK